MEQVGREIEQVWIGPDVELKFTAVGRRRPVSTFVEKDLHAFTYLVPAKAVTGRFAPQRRSLLPRFFDPRSTLMPTLKALHNINE